MAFLRNQLQQCLKLLLRRHSSDEPGDLIFEAGEYITVTTKNGDWWTGIIGERTGVFPYNYVEPAPEGGAATVSDVAPVQDSWAQEAQLVEDTSAQATNESDDKSDFPKAVLAALTLFGFVFP